MKYLRNFPEVNFVGFILMKLTCKYDKKMFLACSLNHDCFSKDGGSY